MTVSVEKQEHIWTVIIDRPDKKNMGLANYLVPEGKARQEAERLAEKISAFPQLCLRSDRQAVYQGLDQPLARGMKQEFELGLKVVQSGETRQGARQFVNRDR